MVDITATVRSNLVPRGGLVVTRYMIVVLKPRGAGPAPHRVDRHAAGPPP